MDIEKIKNNPDGTPKKTYGEALEEFKQGYGLDPGLAEAIKPLTDQFRAAAAFKELTSPKELPYIKPLGRLISKQDVAELIEQQHAKARPMKVWNVFVGIFAIIGVIATIVATIYVVLTYYK